MKILQFVLTSQAKYIQPELRKQRDKIEANVVEKWIINGLRMPELASHLAISGALQVHRRLLLCWLPKNRPFCRFSNEHYRYLSPAQNGKWNVHCEFSTADSTPKLTSTNREKM